MDWKGQVAIVTGGSRGIGAAICRRLAARGAAVGINYVARSTEAEALRAEIVAAGGRAALLQADVADSAAGGNVRRGGGKTGNGVDPGQQRRLVRPRHVGDLRCVSA